MAVDEIILVAGLNYTKYHVKGKSLKLEPAGPGPWRDYAVRWAEKKFKEDNTVKLTLFDFFKGTREGITFSKGKPAFTIEMTAKPLDFDNYRRLDTTAKLLLPPEPSLPLNTIDVHILYLTGVSELSLGPVKTQDYVDAFIGAHSSPPAEKSISVLDVYQYVIDVGKTRPNTVKEFHLFSHAWAGGPILVNCKDLAITPPALKRDPLDKDPRAGKDFNGSNVNPADIEKAFKKDATSFIWGCIAWTFMKQLVRFTNDQKSKISDPNAKKFQFIWTTDWVDSLDEFHAQLGGAPLSNKSDKLSLNDVKKVITDAMNSTYMQNLATASKNRVLGALPGTYSDLDNKGPTAERFLHIPIGAKSSNKADENFSRTLNFYDKTMGVQFEPTKYGGWTPYGRGYGIYK